MKLCDFDVGLDHPLFVIAGIVAARSRGPFGDAPRTRYAERECGKGRTRLHLLLYGAHRGCSRKRACGQRVARTVETIVGARTDEA